MPTELQEDIAVGSSFGQTEQARSCDALAKAVGVQPQVKVASAYCIKKAVALGAVVVLVMLIGEVWLRAPGAPIGIQYAFDEELGLRYLPNQIARPRLMGLFAVDAPPMIIDEDGFRNSRVDWMKPMVLALGSSELVGPGVAEEDIWTVRLSDLFNNGGKNKFVVYNAGTASYGPFHQMVVLRRFVQQHRKPALIIVRASVADREFLPMSGEELRREKVRKDQRDRIKHYSLFLPFLFAKLQLQLESLKNIPALLRSGQATGVLAESSTQAAAERMWDQHKKYWIEMVSFAQHLGVPIVIFVSDPYGTDAGEALFRSMSRTFGKSPCTFVWLLDARPFGLFQGDAEERLRMFTKKYTLQHDPHANALQHNIIAKELFKYLQSVKDLNDLGTCRTP